MSDKKRYLIAGVFLVLFGVFSWVALSLGDNNVSSQAELQRQADKAAVEAQAVDKEAQDLEPTVTMPAPDSTTSPEALDPN